MIVNNHKEILNYQHQVISELDSEQELALSRLQLDIKGDTFKIELVKKEIEDIITKNGLRNFNIQVSDIQ